MSAGRKIGCIPWNKGIYRIHESYQKWLNDKQPKIFCKCKCGKEIIVKEYCKSNGIPNYISGHNKSTKGAIFTEQHRKNLSISHIGLPANMGSGTGKGCYYNSSLQGKIYLRSSYELKFARYLDENNIPWLYEIKTFDLGNTTYTPDFYLPTCNLFIEIKGYMRPKAQEKINKFLDNYIDETLQILYKKDLIKLGLQL